MQTYQPDKPLKPQIAFIQPLAIGLLIAVAFVVTYLYALHKPEARDLPVGVAPPAIPAAELRRTVGDAVELKPMADLETARRQVADGKIVAAYAGGRLLVAGAQGPATVQTVTGVFTRVAAARGTPLQVEDVVPLSGEDPRGLSGFYLLFGLTLAGFIFGQTSHLYSKTLSPKLRLVQALLFALLAGVAGALIAGPLIGVMPGPFLAVAGILVLLALAVALVTMALTRLLSDPGILVSTILLVILGNAASGGAVSVYFLPDGFRQLSPWLPPGAATHALADVVYFDAGAALSPVVVLAAWGAGALLLLLVIERRRVASS